MEEKMEVIFSIMKMVSGHGGKNPASNWKCSSITKKL